MAEFKFVYREEELMYAKQALLTNNFVVYNYFNNSGLSHYLKKLRIDLNNKECVCFYISCEHEKNIATQIAEQIISNCEQTELKRHTKNGGEVFKRIVSSFASSIDLVPHINLGELITGFIDAIKDTTDVDINHLADYKIEKAITNMLDKLIQKQKNISFCLLLDDVSNLTTSSVEFIAKILTYDCVKILITIPNTHAKMGLEILSKLSNDNHLPYQINKSFERPDNRLISGLFKCYNQNLKDEYYDIFERYERNIHIIMSYIRGFNMNFMQLKREALCILKIMILLKTAIDANVLKKIYEKNMHYSELLQVTNFSVVATELAEKGFIEYNNCISLNHKIVTNEEIQISLIEKLTISRDIIDTFEIYKNHLTIPQLKFAIDNLDKDYNRRKTYILLLLKKQKEQGKVEQQYLDMLFYLDKKADLLEICSLYYNLQIYDVPYIRIQQHMSFSKDRKCQMLLALLQERMHKDNYCEKLWELVNSSTNLNEQCLIMSVLFTALFNNGDNELCLKILYNSDYEYYYQKFESSYYYHFLLRNISYYIADVEMGISNYEYCLSKFKNSDPVNFNRTISNYIGYLMKHDNNQHAKIVLSEKIKEVKSILEFNDSKYLYLNINYGIYLMREEDMDPAKYFESILYDSGTTETPYIYAKVNQAMYIAKVNPAKALTSLDEIYNQSIRNSNVIPTKIFYKINRILVEYMNGINNTTLLEEIKSNPLRGDGKYSRELYQFYSYRFKNKKKYMPTDWKKRFLPGYIFYHGFDAELLLSSFDNPVCKI